MSTRENPPTDAAAWTYRMEVSPTGQKMPAISNTNDPIILLHLLVNLQNQTLESQRQVLEIQRQQLEISRELLQVNREQRAARAPSSSDGRRGTSTSSRRAARPSDGWSRCTPP